MPSQVPSFSSFELPQIIESEPSSSRHDKKRRRHRLEEGEHRRHRHRSTDDDHVPDGEDDGGQRHRRKTQADSREDARRNADSRGGETRKYSSSRRESSRDDRDERHRSKHRREHNEHSTDRTAIEYSSKSNSPSAHGHSTPSAEAYARQRSKTSHSAARYDSPDSTLLVQGSSVWSVSLVKAVTKDWSGGSYDVRGDGMASRYGGPEASQIPKYKRAGKGAVLGLPLHLRIVATTNRGIDVINSRKLSAQASKAQIWLQRMRPAQRRITPSVGGPTFGEGQKDYVKLQTVARRSSSGNDQIVDPFDIAAGKISPDQEHSSSSGSDIDDDEPRDGVEEAAFKIRLREADQRTRSHPAEVRAWLALADLQQHVVSGTLHRHGHGFRERGSAARKTTAEVQLSVLDKGQRAHAENSASIPLGLARLQVAISGSLWDDVKVEGEFRRLLDSRWEKSGSDGLRQAQAVWAQYLSWKPTSASATLSGLSDSYAEALRTIATFQHASGIAFCFSLQLRLCELLQRAGYPARAFAILQAQVELTLVHFSPGREEAKDVLQRHWDCEEPRIGETGAVLQVGATSKRHEKRARSASPSTSKHVQGHRRSPLDQWVATQKDLACLRQRPARTDDPPIYSAGEGEVDPFSVVLFSDVRPFLISGLPSANCLLALRNFAKYFGLETNDGRAYLSHDPGRPVLKHIATEEWSARFWPSSLQQEWQKEKIRSCNADLEVEPKQQRRLSNPWACPLLSATRPLNSLAFPPKEPTPPLAKADVTWLNLMLDQLPTSTGQEQGTISALQLATATKGGDTSILEDPVRKLEDAEDRADFARACIFALDEVPSSLSSELELGVVDAVERHIGLGQADVALHILWRAVSNGHRYVSGEEDLPVTVAQQLKARRYYSNIRENADEDASPASLPAIVSAAWYHYLMGAPARRLAIMLEFFDGFVSLDPSDHTHSLCEARLRIVWYHLSLEKPVYRPADVRRVLIQSIRLFPHDLTFQALLAAHESRFKIEGVVGRTLEDVILRPLEQAAESRLQSLASVVEGRGCEDLFRLERKGESSWLMAIYIELHFNSEVVNSHLVRSLFERALQQEATKASNVLWTLYLSFEVRTASKALATLHREKQQGRDRRDRDRNRNHDRGGAKAQARTVKLRTQQKLFTRSKRVFYRALSACPFERDIYLHAYEHPFRLAFSAEELRQLYSVMDDERELRVFGRIEELLIVEAAERGGQGVGGGAGESESDVETDDDGEDLDFDRVQ